MPTLRADQEASVIQEISLLNTALDSAFAEKNELAAIIQQIGTLKLEMAHFEKFFEEIKGGDLQMIDQAVQSELSAQKLLQAWLASERELKRHAKAGVASSSTRRVGFLKKIGFRLRFGTAASAFFELGAEERIPLLQKAYYQRKLADLEQRRKALEGSLAGFEFDERLERLTGLSMQLLKHRLAKHYNKRERRIFAQDELWQEPEQFLEEYPVILSTTFSIITSLKNGYLFDCVIVDEASQVDLLSGVLAMGCAKQLVIVGDPMQLPNVLTEQDEQRAKEVTLQS